MSTEKAQEIKAGFGADATGFHSKNGVSDTDFRLLEYVRSD